MSKNKKKKEEAIYHLTAREIAGIKQNAEYEALKKMKASRKADVKRGSIQARNEAYIYFLGVAAIVMHDEYKWDIEQTSELLEHLVETYNNTEDLLSLLVKTNEYSGWDITPELDDLIGGDDIE